MSGLELTTKLSEIIDQEINDAKGYETKGEEGEIREGVIRMLIEELEGLL